jgi:hypothetical protein
MQNEIKELQMAKNEANSKGNLFIKYGGETAIASPGKGPDGYYPSLTLSDKAVPELADKKVGDKCELCITGKIKSITANEGQDTRIEFEVNNAEYEDSGKDSKKSKDDVGEYDKASMKKTAGMMQKIKKMRKA